MVALQPTPHQSLRDSFSSRRSLGFTCSLSLPLEGKVHFRKKMTDEVENQEFNKPEFVGVLGFCEAKDGGRDSTSFYYPSVLPAASQRP